MEKDKVKDDLGKNWKNIRNCSGNGDEWEFKRERDGEWGDNDKVGDKENSLGKNVGMDDKRKVRNNEKYNDKYWNNKKKDWMERK